MVRIIKKGMSVGPKGQVVIPQILREALKIYPGSEVTFRLERGRLVIERPAKDVVKIFRKIAAGGKGLEKIHPHKAYKEELKKRLG